MTIEVGVFPQVLTGSPQYGKVFCGNRDNTSISVISDSIIGVAEGRKPQAASCKPEPTIVRGVLYLTPSSLSHHPSSLLDISGRKVLDLKPGPNDVRRLSLGVYFVHPSPGVTRDAPSVERVSRVVIVE